MTVPSTSGTDDGDGEDTYVDDLINNNNSKYATNLSVTKAMPRLVHKDDITKKEGSNHVAISQNQNEYPKIKINANNVKRVVPSLEELKKQLVNSDIDISEIKMRCEDEEEAEDVDDGGIMEYNEGDEFLEESYSKEESLEDHDPANEDISEDAEGEEESNQSFYYDQELGGHFLFKASDQDSESNYEDDGIMTPNFGMVEELYHRANLAATTSISNDPSVPANSRRRTFHNPCKLCNKVFPSLSMLKKHAKTHLNEDGQHLHLCKFCFQYYPNASSLSKHLRVHTEENPNVCTGIVDTFRDINSGLNTIFI